MYSFFSWALSLGSIFLGLVLRFNFYLMCRSGRRQCGRGARCGNGCRSRRGAHASNLATHQTQSTYRRREGRSRCGNRKDRRSEPRARLNDVSNELCRISSLIGLRLNGLRGRGNVLYHGPRRRRRTSLRVGVVLRSTCRGTRVNARDNGQR